MLLLAPRHPDCTGRHQEPVPACSATKRRPLLPQRYVRARVTHIYRRVSGSAGAVSGRHAGCARFKPRLRATGGGAPPVCAPRAGPRSPARVSQSVALLLNTSADVLTAAASSDPARALALTGTFMATAQVRARAAPRWPCATRRLCRTLSRVRLWQEVDATLRAAVAKHTAPQSFMRSPSLVRAACDKTAVRQRAVTRHDATLQAQTRANVTEEAARDESTG